MGRKFQLPAAFLEKPLGKMDKNAIPIPRGFEIELQRG
jgi:hypothetical protein